MRPTWEPFASDMLAEQQLHFSLRLMTGGDMSKYNKLKAAALLWQEGGARKKTNVDLLQTVWLISPATGIIAITQGLADFAATVKDAK